MKGIKKHRPLFFTNPAHVGRLPHNVLQVSKSIIAKALIPGRSKIETIVVKTGNLMFVAVDENSMRSPMSHIQ